MTHEAQQHSLSQWLDLHELRPAVCRRLLDAMLELVDTGGPRDAPADAGSSTLDLQTSWLTTADAMRAFFPAQSCIINDTFEKTARTLIPMRAGSRKAVTIDHGPNTYPTIVYSFSGERSELLVLAHEFAHALQIRASDGRFVAPIMREICAFIGELVQIAYASEDVAQHHLLSRAWSLENQRYFGAGGRRLRSALPLPDLAYRYAWNYPIARYLSIRVRERLPPDRIWALFEGRLSVAALLRDLDLASDLA